MLKIDNINKIDKVFLGRKYRVEIIIDAPSHYCIQLKHITNSNIIIAMLYREATQRGKYRLKVFNKSDYLTLRDLRDINIVKDRLKNLIK